MTTQRITKRAVDALKPNGSGFTVWDPGHLAFQMPRVDSLNTHQKRKEEPGWGEPGSLKITQLA
jgi:hypothetical protein